MSYQVSSGAPSWRSGSLAQVGAGDFRISGSRRSGLDLAAMKSVMESSLPSLRSGVDSLLHNNHQEMMQELNQRLAGYLQRVRGLEEENQKLQEEIEEISTKKSPAPRDWETHQAPLQLLRKQMEDLNMESAKLLLQIDNARLAADDFKVKLEAEQAICDGVNKDTQGLRKMIDDTNFLRMKLESEVETLREELAHLHRDHREEVEALQALIANNKVKIEVDEPKKPDLNDSIAQIRSQYEKMAEQNRTEAENAYKNKFDALSQETNVNTKALEQVKSEVADLRRQLQSLEMERQTLQKTVDSLDHVLKDTEDHYGSNLMELNRLLTRLQDELATCRADIERQVQDYDTLLNLKYKLENEIQAYRTLLEGAADRDGAESSRTGGTNTVQKVTVTQHEIVNGEVVSKSSAETIK
ncbi:keratin, type I cytoskeletal 18-like [Dendropsophus ebraccatus]|uniref:keratin, type I cytoskeletal 18-like n=1 Tax=Dendropsophus ebraccatus TaxID=150705 RepID=UPI003831522E